MTSAAAGALVAGHSTNVLRQALQLLLRAHLLLLTPSRWTREYWAVDLLGHETEPTDSWAIRWCVGGAVLHAHASVPGSKAPIEIPVDPVSNEATRVTSPKRAVVALELLGHCLLETNRVRISQAAGGGTGAQTLKKLEAQHPTLRASDINDLPQIGHLHVLQGVLSAAVAIHEELEDRRRMSRERIGAL